MIDTNDPKGAKMQGHKYDPLYVAEQRCRLMIRGYEDVPSSLCSHQFDPAKGDSPCGLWANPRNHRWNGKDAYLQTDLGTGDVHCGRCANITGRRGAAWLRPA